MTNLVLIAGDSGTGKSTSISTLNEKETFLINVLSKSLPFKGYSKRYSSENKNYIESDNYREIIAYLKAINDRRPEIKHIIIDDYTFIMANEFMNKAREKGYEKFTELGCHSFEILETLRGLRSDLFCFLLSHTEQDASGKIKARTIGRMVDDKICLQERMTTVLHSTIIDGEYKFLTQGNGINLAKSPRGMFDALYIDNDLQMVVDKMKEYFNEDEE